MAQHRAEAPINIFDSFSLMLPPAAYGIPHPFGQTKYISLCLGGTMLKVN
jgi:hypothetical protein